MNEVYYSEKPLIAQGRLVLPYALLVPPEQSSSQRKSSSIVFDADELASIEIKIGQIQECGLERAAVIGETKLKSLLSQHGEGGRRLSRLLRFPWMESDASGFLTTFVALKVYGGMIKHLRQI